MGREYGVSGVCIWHRHVLGGIPFFRVYICVAGGCFQVRVSVPILTGRAVFRFVQAFMKCLGANMALPCGKGIHGPGAVQLLANRKVQRLSSRDFHGHCSEKKIDAPGFQRGSRSLVIRVASQPCQALDGAMADPKSPWSGLLRGSIVGAALLGAFYPLMVPKTSHASPTKPETAETLRTPTWLADVADAGRRGQPMSPEEIDAETRAAIARSGDERLQKQMKRANHRSKGGKLVKDPSKSRVPDPTSIPSNKEIEKMALQSAWRPDKLKDMTYTQFWNLVEEGHVESVKYTSDRRSVVVRTRNSAPGGARVEKVGLPYDPELFDHMVNHGTYIIPSDPNPALPVVHALVRLVFPVWFSFLLIKFAFRIGRKKKRDKIFGGAKLESVSSKDATITFDDIAGIDQVKSEITEVVSFLKDPQKFLKLGARSPAGVLLVGPPGTGKTLLAKAIAGEAGVPFFSIAGTEFMEMFVGVGASRVRDMFQQARDNSPCILFIDEFDGLGKAREYGGAGNDESVHTINQLLAEMDGFEDNTGVVVMAATNRPAALDQALTRPGRFDRIVHLPLPNVEGRVGILKVHARDKKVDPDIDFSKLARATAGFTGAELMNLMNQAAIIAARQKQPFIGNDEAFEALEKIHREKMGGSITATEVEQDTIPERMRRTIAIYEAARALVGYITPKFDEIQRVSVCPGGLATGYTYFLPMEERLESRITTRAYLESRMVVALAGRCAEQLVLGEANLSTAGATDLEMANSIAREMVYRCGFGRRTGPVALMDNEEVYLNKSKTKKISDISTDMAKVAYQDVVELLEGAEAKSYWALVANYEALEKLSKVLYEEETLTGEQVAQVIESCNPTKFDAPYVSGFSWSENGELICPDKKGETSTQNGVRNEDTPSWWSPKNPYSPPADIANLLGEYS